MLGILKCTFARKYAYEYTLGCSRGSGMNCFAWMVFCLDIRRAFIEKHNCEINSIVS